MDLEQVIEASDHGADCGWPGFTYTLDAARFYEANTDDVWELLDECADDFGLTPLALVASFGAAATATSASAFATLLAWFALEEVGRWAADR